MRYKKRSDFEAHQWTGEFNKLPDWLLEKTTGERDGKLIISIPIKDFRYRTLPEPGVEFDVEKGDYILHKGGHIEIMSKKLFELTYEPVAEKNITFNITAHKDIDIKGLMENIKTLTERGNSL